MDAEENRPQTTKPELDQPDANSRLARRQAARLLEAQRAAEAAAAEGRGTQDNASDGGGRQQVNSGTPRNDAALHGAPSDETVQSAALEPDLSLPSESTAIAPVNPTSEPAKSQPAFYSVEQEEAPPVVQSPPPAVQGHVRTALIGGSTPAPPSSQMIGGSVSNSAPPIPNSTQSSEARTGSSGWGSGSNSGSVTASGAADTIAKPFPKERKPPEPGDKPCRHEYVRIYQRKLKGLDRRMVMTRAFLPVGFKIADFGHLGDNSYCFCSKCRARLYPKRTQAEKLAARAALAMGKAAEAELLEQAQAAEEAAQESNITDIHVEELELESVDVQDITAEGVKLSDDAESNCLNDEDT